MFFLHWNSGHIGRQAVLALSPEALLGEPVVWRGHLGAKNPARSGWRLGIFWDCEHESLEVRGGCVGFGLVRTLRHRLGRVDGRCSALSRSKLGR